MSSVGARLVAADVDLLRQMLLVRRFEERCAALYGERKIRGFLHLYVGQEAVATGVVAALAPDDNIVATYREHGHALVRGVPAGAVMAEMFGKVEGCSRGRGGSMHLFSVEHRFFGGNAIVAGGLPLALGLALADALGGSERVSACFFGEGAVAEGAFHETMNLAALWQAPLVLCCENNLYAMGTSLGRSQSMTDLSLKAAGYGVPAWSVDGMDVIAVREATRRAVLHARAGGGPVFLELRTYRFRAHSMYDPELYRARAEVDAWREHDPIDTFASRLIGGELIDAAGVEAAVAEAEQAVDEAVRFAEAGSDEPEGDLLRHLYGELSTPRGSNR